MPRTVGLILACVLLGSATGSATEDVVRDQADRTFHEGARLAADGVYDEALVRFERSFAYRASLNTIWNIAVCHLMSGNRDLAVALFDRYLQHDGRYRASSEIQRAVAAIAAADDGISDVGLREELWRRLRSAEDAVTGGTATRVDDEATDLEFGGGLDTSEASRRTETVRSRGRELFREGSRASNDGDHERAQWAFERSLVYLSSPNAVYNTAVCHLVLGRRDLADHFLHRYLDERPDRRSDPRVEAVVRAIQESPQGLGDRERRYLLWEQLHDGVERPIEIAVGGVGGRQVPEHLDRVLAMIEGSFHGTVDLNTTCFLLRVARSKDQYLMHPPSPMGPCHRAAMARSLILISETIERRMRADHGDVGCLEWDPDDPLAGLLEAVSPFGMVDAWSAIESEESRRCEGPPTAPRRRPSPVPRPVPPGGTTPPDRPVPPEPPTPDGGPSPPPDLCGRRENWIDCARRDSRLSQNIRNMLGQFPNLDQRFISAQNVRTLQADGSLDIPFIDRFARRGDPNEMIRRHQREALDYDAFRERLVQLQEEVRLSARRMLADTVRCAECVPTSCAILKDQWFYFRQRDSTSIYHFFR